MKRKIFKYDIQHAKKQHIKLPLGAEILCVQVQNNEPYIWALVDVEAEEEERVFLNVPTGSDINYDMGIEYKYIGTYMLNDPSAPTGTFVGHLFEQL